MANVMGFLREQNTKTAVEQASLIVPKDFRHSYAVGQTGCGKTSSYIYPNINDKIEAGNGLLIFDHKGKEHRSVKYFAHKHNRLSDVLEIGTPWSVSCNLIKYFNDKELKSFVVSLMSMNDANDYWSVSGSNLISAINKAIKAYQSIIEEAEHLNIKKSFLNVVVTFKLPTGLTFSVMADVCKSTASIASFLSKVQKLSKRYETYVNNKVTDWSERNDQTVVKSKYLDLMTAVLFFKNIVENELKSLEVFKDALEETNRSTSFQTLILAMSTTFSSVAENKSFNDPDGTDLADALNNGKIIVVNSQEISNVILSTLTGSLLGELSKRVRQTNIKPISIFVDEAQRVLTPDTDLYTDVLREAKVELFLAFQNNSLMINAIGKTKFAALIQNLTTSFHFKNASDYLDLETSKLDVFEYYKNSVEKVCKANPIFLVADEIFDADLKYFTINNIYEQLNINEQDRDKVIEFHPYLFQQGKINLKSKNDDIKTIKLRDKKRELESLKVIDELIINHQVVLTHKKYVQQQKISKGQSRLPDLVGQALEDINEFMGTEE